MHLIILIKPLGWVRLTPADKLIIITETRMQLYTYWINEIINIAIKLEMIKWRERGGDEMRRRRRRALRASFDVARRASCRVASETGADIERRSISWRDADVCFGPLGTHRDAERLWNTNLLPLWQCDADCYVTVAPNLFLTWLISW